ncbi:MAG: thioredoxin [Thermoplasmata archaeon]|nr:thioredoxin [Thermoplasmata archaeon]
MPDEIEEIRQKKLDKMIAGSSSGAPSNEFPDAPVKVTDSDFEKFIGRYENVVVDCWAPWCAPCRVLSTTIDTMAKEHKGKIVFGKLNTDENFETASKFGIMSIPTLLYFRKGDLVSKTIGALPRDAIEEHIQSLKS